MRPIIAIVVYVLAFSDLHAFEIPEEIILNEFSKIALTREQQDPFYDNYSPVRMPHQVHLIIDCEACHHKWPPEMESPQKCTAAGCHDILERNTNSENKIFTASFAYHSRNHERSCVGCHHAKKIAGEQAGPVVCSKCHKSD